MHMIAVFNRISNNAQFVVRVLTLALLLFALAWAAFDPFTAGTFAATAHAGAAHVAPVIYHLGPYNPCPGASTPC